MRKDNAIEVFFALVRAGLWEDIKVNGEGVMVKDSSLFFSPSIDWQEVYQIAEEQSTFGLVAAGLERVKVIGKKGEERSNVPKVILLQFAGQALVLEQRNTAMNKFLGELVDKMRAAGINTLLVKGQGVAQSYERPLWRTCGDIDLFLSDDDYEKAKEMLIPLASEVEKESDFSKHLGLTIDSWVVELHGSLRMGMPPKINRELDVIKREAFCEGNVSSWTNGGTQIFMLSHENDVVYVFTHFLNHFYKGGIGLRQICDWTRLLWTYRDTLDSRVLESRIKRMGLMTEWKAFGAFAVNFLGMPKEAMLFYEEKSKWECKAKRIKDFVIMSGNFGHNRDMSYFSKYPYLIRKVRSLGRRLGDMWNHARIFPMNTIRFAPSFLFHGLRAAANGE